MIPHDHFPALQEVARESTIRKINVVHLPPDHPTLNGVKYHSMAVLIEHSFPSDLFYIGLQTANKFENQRQKNGTNTLEKTS